MILLQLYWEFFKIGLFAIGGGLATLPFLYNLSDKTGWFTHGDLTNMIAVGESTPGPIGVNTATYVGYTTADIPGAIIATLGLVTPSVIIILIIASFLKNFRENRYVDAVFYGLRPASTALITASGLTVAMSALLYVDHFSSSSLVQIFNWQSIILAIIIYLLSGHIKFTKKLHPIVFIGLSAVVGIIFSFAGV